MIYIAHSITPSLHSIEINFHQFANAFLQYIIESSPITLTASSADHLTPSSYLISAPLPSFNFLSLVLKITTLITASSSVHAVTPALSLTSIQTLQLDNTASHVEIKAHQPSQQQQQRQSPEADQPQQSKFSTGTNNRRRRSQSATKVLVPIIVSSNNGHHENKHSSTPSPSPSRARWRDWC